MEPTEEIDFSKYEWQESWPSRILYWIARAAFFMFNLMYTLKIFPPLGYRLTGFEKLPASETFKMGKVILVEIAKSIGVDDETSRATLTRHWKRLVQHQQIIGPLSFTVGFLITGLATILPFLGLYSLFGYDLYESMGELFLAAFVAVMFWVSFQLSRRFITSMINKHYADTLVSVGALYFMIELLHKDALALPESRKRLQERLNLLSQNILLLSSQFESGSPQSQQRIYSHFKGMEHYVREHEQLIVAPKADSLDILRKDFYHLLKILVSGRYGEFNHEYPPSTPDANRKGMAGILSIINFVIPILVVLALYLNPQRIAAMGININTMVLVALAWFLLTIDATLKLGIVERVSGLAKSIRDLG